MYDGIACYDDLNEGEEFDKETVIAARRLEMQFFKTLGVYLNVNKKEVQKCGGNVITIRWIDTEQGQGVYRSR